MTRRTVKFGSGEGRWESAFQGSSLAAYPTVWVVLRGGGHGDVSPLPDTSKVQHLSCFSAGFKTSKGEVLIPGDEIIIAGSRARVLAVDREASVLTIDHILSWNKGDAANYLYEGSGPDVGAIERQ